MVEGSVHVGTILFWTYLLEWAGHRFPAVERILHAPPLVLIENGQMLRKNMRTELVTKDELMAQLREKGGVSGASSASWPFGATERDVGPPWTTGISRSQIAFNDYSNMSNLDQTAAGLLDIIILRGNKG